jgi:hypothetical protein
MEDTGMTRRNLASLPLVLGALTLFGACVDSPMAPVTPSTEVYADQIAPAAFPDTSDFRQLSGALWICATGNLAGNDFHYKFNVTDKATGTVVAKGTIHNVSIGQCVLAATVPTDVHGRYYAVVKQDAPMTFYLAHGFFNFGYGYPAAPPTSTVDLKARTMTSWLSNDGGVVMNFYNLLRTPT